LRRIAKPAGLWIAGGLLFAILETAMIWVRIHSAPLLWIWLLWTLAAAGLSAAAVAPGRAAWLNVAAVLAALALTEGLLWMGLKGNPYRLAAGTVMGGTFVVPGYFVLMPSPGIGYRPRPSASATSTRVVDGRLVYAVRYSVDADGLRVSPPTVEAPWACFLMFGDSMAWGEGLDDEETAAYQLGLSSGGQVRARNFAFTGYSAHQMLWLVDSGAVRLKAHCDPRRPVAAVYQTLPNNVARVAGLEGWDDYGPRYRLAGNGRLSYAGGFDRGQSILNDRLFVPQALALQLSRSLVYARVLGRLRPVNDFDLLRFSIVVREAAAGLRRLYPRLTFLTIVWPDLNDPPGVRAKRVDEVVAALRRQGVPTVTIEDLQPGFGASPLPFVIPGDGHPNALMQRRLALALLARETALAAPRAQAR